MTFTPAQKDSVELVATLFGDKDWVAVKDRKTETYAIILSDDMSEMELHDAAVCSLRHIEDKDP